MAEVAWDMSTATVPELGRRAHLHESRPYEPTGVHDDLETLGPLQERLDALLRLLSINEALSR